MRKLTESDKKEILKLYRESAETTSTLAERYDVSNSTISRLLKSTLPEDEYEFLVSLKRAARTPEGRAQVSYENLPDFIVKDPEEEIAPQAVISKAKVGEPRTVDKPKPKPVKRQAQPEPEDIPEPTQRRVRRVIDEPVEPTPVNRRARRVVDEPVEPTPVRRVRRVQEEPEPTPINRRVRRRSIEDEPLPMAEQLELLDLSSPSMTPIPSPLIDDAQSEATVMAAAEILGEDLLEADELDDLDDLDDEDDDFDYEDDYEPVKPLVKRPRSGEGVVRILPLSAAPLPKTCYLVIDRAAELITRPLRDFGDLGQIPNIETQQKTLPVFDNHRVAKRFSTKRDRVIKVPDSRMLHKTRIHLQAKGITRLLIDGQVYSLAGG